MRDELKLILNIVVVTIFLISYSNLYSDYQSNLDETKSIIKDCNETVNSLSDFIDEQEDTILNLSIQNENLSIELENTKQKLNEAIRQKKSIKNNLNQINKEYENMKTQKGLINPTYRELKNFVDRDNTDKLEYDEDSFVCTEFSYRFISNFAKKGYFSCETEINFEDGAHSIVAVNTTDKGLVYVEPQSDKIIKADRLQVDKNYCSLVGWNCYWEITKISNCFELKI